MTKVFVVKRYASEGHSYEIIGIYTSKKLAEEACDRCDQEAEEGVIVGIEPYFLNSYLGQL